MPLVICPSCQRHTTAVEPSAIMRCPYCHFTFTLSALTPPPQPTREQRSAPQLTPAAAPSSGWFTRGFLCALGVLAALLLVLLAIPMVTVGIATFIYAASESESREVREAKADAIKCARPALGRNGIVELSDDVTASVSRYRVLLIGTGRSIDNKLHDFEAHVVTRRFDSYEVTELKLLAIDGVIVEGSK